MYSDLHSGMTRSPQNIVSKLRMLQVPLEIHNEWKQGGASRARLQELFQQCNFDKAYGSRVHETMINSSV